MKAISVKDNNKVWLHVGLLVIAIVIAYSKLFHAGFIDWDDNEYVTHNSDISGITMEHISQWFSTFYIGNYHPLTMLSYAVDHLIGGTSPGIYHTTNILLHAGTAVTIYFFINRLQEHKLTGLFVALFFALHPSQTESVSWVAERKTVLCGLFYFLALLRYTSYLNDRSVKKLAIVFLLGLCAVLSKGVGVVLPLSMLAVDIWMQRDLKDKKVWLEKLPFFIVSVIFGIVAIKAQEAGKFLGEHGGYSWLETAVLAGYAYVQYIVHLFMPVRLSVIYPYPREIGIVHYLCFALALGILSLGVVAYRKKWYVLCGGILFYTVNIALLLQFIQFGAAIMADRYLYISGVGIIFPACYYLFRWLRHKGKEMIAAITSAIVAMLLLVLTFVHNDLWLSEFAFFSSILDTNPESATAQFSVGGLLMRQGNYDEAEAHIDQAISLEPNNYKAWYNKGVLSSRQHKLAEALEAFNKCLSIKEYTKAYFSRAMLYQSGGQTELAIADADRVLADQPENARAYFIKASCLEEQGKIADAVDNYSKAIQYDHSDPLFYTRRGMIYGRTKQNAEALRDLDAAVALNPRNGETLYYRGIVKYHAGQSPCDDLKAALQYGYKQARDALAQACNH